MKKIADSRDMFGDPPAAMVRYFGCPNCRETWSQDRKRNLVARGLPDDIVRQLVREGRLNKEGKFFE